MTKNELAINNWVRHGRGGFNSSSSITIDGVTKSIHYREE